VHMGVHVTPSSSFLVPRRDVGPIGCQHRSALTTIIIIIIIISFLLLEMRVFSK
jgi:hypothetical protein